MLGKACLQREFFDPESVYTAKLILNDKALAILYGHFGSVIKAIFNKDGRRIISISYDGTVRILDSTTGKQLAILQGHAEWVSHVDLSRDGSHIVTAGYDGTAGIWDIITGTELAVLQGHLEVRRNNNVVTTLSPLA